MIDYKKAFDSIRLLADLEWNGSITITEFKYLSVLYLIGKLSSIIFLVLSSISKGFSEYNQFFIISSQIYLLYKVQNSFHCTTILHNFLYTLYYILDKKNHL